MKQDGHSGVDRKWMEAALRLARLGEGLTRPNPPVGSVVVSRGRVVGRGWHRQAGGPHAEIHALRQAGERARGATLYVTLEPCSTWGRTPPCTEAIIRSGVSRVVAAVSDPNPRHAGRGFRLLRAAGIEVVSGVAAAEAERLLAPFAASMERKRPYVTLKLAVSLDGRIADARGRSKWISGAASRTFVQSLRRRADVVMVGAGTVSKDNPSLLPRPARGRATLRVIVDGRGTVPVRSRVFTDDAACRTILATTGRCPVSRRAALAKRGAEVLILPPAGTGVSLRALMKVLHRRGALHMLCEGGGRLAETLLKAGLVDELVLFIAPIVIGGAGVAAVGGPGWPLAKAPRFETVEVRKLGKDLMMRAIPARSKSRAKGRG